jgi:hypothetical protein
LLKVLDMPHTLLMSLEQFTAVSAHLLESQREQVGFVFARVTANGEGVQFTAADSYLCEPADYDHAAVDHVQLTDEAQQRIIKTAWDSGCALVELHSHPFVIPRAKELAFQPTACFSPYDARGLAEFAPHVQWRLKGKPYAAIVFGPRDFDALVWPTRGVRPERLDRLQAGERVMRPTGLTLAAPRLLELLESEARP